MFEHRDAIGRIGTQPVRASVLGALGPLLVARGTDAIIIPVPGSRERERVEEGLGKIPRTRAQLVHLVDRDGSVLERVREYLRPLRLQAQRWPEDAFVSFTEAFLYRTAIAARHKAGIIHDSVQTLREFIPIVDAAYFTDEARYRLADIVSLVCAYQPFSPEYPAFTADADASVVGRTVWQIIEMSEYRDVVAENGRLGLLRSPGVALTHLSSLVKGLLRRPEAQGVLEAGSTVADLAAGGHTAETIARVAEKLSEPLFSSDFRPPFYGLGPASLTLYRVALNEAFPGAQPLDGTIMVFEAWRAGGTSTSWLSVGEEDKLAREEAEGARRRQAAFARAREAQRRLFE